MTYNPDALDCHWHVYYCYAADGALLYVGQSGDPETRYEWHRYYSVAEWPGFCVRIDVGPELPSLADARAMERQEIARLRPVFNRHHNPDPSPWLMPPLTERQPYNYRPEVVYLTAERVAS